MLTPTHLLRDLETQVAAVKAARRTLKPLVAQIVNTPGVAQESLDFCAAISAADDTMVSLLQTVGQALPFRAKRDAMTFETFDTDGAPVTE